MTVDVDSLMGVPTSKLDFTVPRTVPTDSMDKFVDESRRLEQVKERK